MFFSTLAFAFVEPYFFIGYLISIALFGLYQAIFMANAGGAWDNAKKIVEVELKQKGTPLHDATVVGDTVGDPFKDTSSVALNPIIKFTTLFGLLAVELAVSLSREPERGPRCGLLRRRAGLRVPLVLRHADREQERVGPRKAGAAAAGRRPVAASISRDQDHARARLHLPRRPVNRPLTRPAARSVLLDAAHPHARGAAGQSLPADEGGRGLFRSLGQEACAVGSAYALRREDVLSPLIRNLGSMLVKGATPLEVLRQYMARGDSPTRGRELNIHFGDVVERNFVGQISHLGDMVPVMAGVTLSFRLRNQPRVGLVYVGDGATSTGAFHEGINFAAVQRCPLVVVVENNGYAYSTPTSRQCAAERLIDKAAGYGIPGIRADGNDVLEVYRVTREAVDRAREGGGVTLLELMTYRRKGHAEHDNQSYVPDGEIDRWAAENDPLDRYAAALTGSFGLAADELAAVDERVRAEVDAATDEADRSPAPVALDALTGVYADPPAQPALWFRAGVDRAVDRHERAEGWGTWNG